MSLLDGDDNQEGLQRLTFDYDQANFDGPGQVLFAYHGQDDEVTLIRFNFDDDDEAEFEIEIVGRYDFSDDDFIT